MLIWLHDLKTKEDNTYELQVDYSVQCQDLLIVLYNKNETCTLLNKQQSAPYNSYTFRRVSHIIQGSISMDNELYSLTFACYISDSKMRYCIIDCESQNGIRFGDTTLDDEGYQGSVLINYKEYCDISAITGSTPQPLSDFITKYLKKEYTTQDYTLYHLKPDEEQNLNAMVSAEELNKFLDEEEIRTVSVLAN